MRDDDPPDPTASDADSDAIARLWPAAESGLVCELNFDEWSGKLDRLEAAEAEAKNAEAEIKAIKNQLKAAAGDAEYIECGTRRFSYKEQSRAGYVVQPTTYRTVRKIKEIGK